MIVDIASLTPARDALTEINRIIRASQPPATQTAADILDKVKSVLSEREGNYDHPRRNFERIAGYWSQYLKDKLKPGETITAEDTGMLMILMKVAREQHKHGEDNLLDTIGYATCVLRCADEVHANADTDS